MITQGNRCKSIIGGPSRCMLARPPDEAEEAVGRFAGSSLQALDPDQDGFRVGV